MIDYIYTGASVKDVLDDFCQEMPGTNCMRALQGTNLSSMRTVKASAFGLLQFSICKWPLIAVWFWWCYNGHMTMLDSLRRFVTRIPWFNSRVCCIYFIPIRRTTISCWICLLLRAARIIYCYSAQYLFVDERLAGIHRLLPSSALLVVPKCSIPCAETTR